MAYQRPGPDINPVSCVDGAMSGSDDSVSIEKRTATKMPVVGSFGQRYDEGEVTDSSEITTNNLAAFGAGRRWKG